MRRALVLCFGLVLLSAGPAEAKRPFLYKRQARAEALRFTAPFVDMTDIYSTVTTRMAPPRKCHRVSAQTVVCRFGGYRDAYRVLSGSVRVHLQRDGLLGFLLDMPTPLDALKRSLDDY